LNPIALSALAVAALSVTACAVGPKFVPLPPEQADARYQKVPLGIASGSRTNLNQAHTVTVYLRFFNSSEKLGICGFYVVPQTFASSQTSLMPVWMEQAIIYSGNSPIAPASFLYARTPRFNEYDAQATCIQTETPYFAFSNAAPIGFIGGNVTEPG
jgi:hypothetical protein